MQSADIVVVVVVVAVGVAVGVVVDGGGTNASAVQVISWSAPSPKELPNGGRAQ